MQRQPLECLKEKPQTTSSDYKVQTMAAKKTINNHCLRDIPGTIPMILMLLGYCTQGLFADCPVVCECKWKGGKEAVSCVNANFTAIPVNLDPGTQALDITSNNIGRLRIEEFKKAGLLNLQKIQLSSCRIKIIEKFAFRDLRNVVELDLSLNFIDMIPTHILSSLPELRDLRLNGNTIQFIGKEAFKNAVRLQKLDISDNKITSISVQAFLGIESTLQKLLLSRNKLAGVDVQSFSILQALNSLEISSNPWNCTCEIREFREWITSQNVPISIQPSCKYPIRLKGKLWDTLDIDEFACVPIILSSAPKVIGNEGQSITLSCKISSIPTPHVRWLLKHKLIANDTATSFIIGKKNYLLKSEKNLSSLTIPVAEVQDATTYTCVAENKAGRSEATVTLVIHKKPVEEVEENKAMIAGIVVSIVLIVAICTLFVFCLSVRKRRQHNRWRQRRSANSSNRCPDDAYEKIEMNKVASDKCVANIAVASVASEVAVMAPARRNGEYRGVPSIDTDQEGDGEPEEEEEAAAYAGNAEIAATPSNPNKSSGESTLWAAAATGRSISSPNSGHWNSNLRDNHLADSNLDPDDLHIPRRTKEETRDDCMKKPNSIYGIYNENQHEHQHQHQHQHQHHHKSYDLAETHFTETQTQSGRSDAYPSTMQYNKSLQPHILRKQILQEGGSLYSSIPVSSSDIEDTDAARYSSRLDISLSNYQQGIQLGRSFISPSPSHMAHDHTLPLHSADDNMYYTLPSRRHSYSRRNSYCGSESPLLPSSICGSGSSGGESNVEIKSSLRRLSEDYSYYNSRTNIYPNLNRRTGSYLNLMSSKQNLYMADSTPLLNVGALEKRYKNLKTPSVKFSSIKSLETAKMYEYHSAQLEKLVVGRYHQMEDEMKQLKEACDNLKQLEVYKKHLRKRMYLESLMHNRTAFSDCEEYIPRSILKKSSYATTSRTPLLMGMRHDLASSSLLSRSQSQSQSRSRSREDFATENLLSFSAHTQ